MVGTSTRMLTDKLTGIRNELGTPGCGTVWL